MAGEVGVPGNAVTDSAASMGKMGFPSSTANSSASASQWSFWFSASRYVFAKVLSSLTREIQDVGVEGEALPITQDKGTGHGYTGLHQCWLFIDLGVKVLAPAVGFLFIGAFEAAET